MKVHTRGWIILIREMKCVVAWYVFSFVLQVPSWSLPTDRCVAFTVSMTIIVSTTNVGWRRSCWDSDFTTPDWSQFLTPTRHSLMNSKSCCRPVTLLVYNNRLMIRVDSVSLHCVDTCDAKSESLPSRSSSIYSLFLHFENSATLSTVVCSKVFYRNTQWNFSLCWFCLGLFSSSSLYVVTLISVSMFATEGGLTSGSDEIVTNPASVNELCFLQIHGALCMTEDSNGFCLTVNGF
jgi:hypothetical protein